VPPRAGARGGGRAGVTGAPELPVEPAEEDVSGGGARQTIASASSP
jgi:hypothetical protein